MLRWFAPLPLLAFMGWLMIGPAREQTVTIDEVAHIGAGLSYVQAFDLRLNGEHPPLAKVLAALPLAVSGVKADYRSLPWTISSEFFPAYLAQWSFGEHVLGIWNPRQRTVALARMPMVGLTLALGFAVYACAVRLGGLAGGLLSLGTYVSTPLFLTFGPLVLTDIILALFTLLSLCGFAAMRGSSSLQNQLLFMLAFAGALLSKFSAPLILIAILVYIRYDGCFWLLRPLAKCVLASALIVYVVYFGLSINQPMDVQHRIGEGPVAHWIGRMLMPGWLYLRGLTMVLMTASRPVYLFGETYNSGLPVYFPLMMLWKSTPGFLILLGAGAMLWRRVPHTNLWRVLWVCCIVLGSACILSRLNIGYRHFAAPLLLLIVLIGALPRLTRNFALRLGMLLCVVSSLWSAIRAHPHFLPYTNGFTLGVPAYRLFGDSNLDWNHALGEVKSFAQERELSAILIDVYGISDPRRDVPGSVLWNCQIPAPEDAGRWAVVSANALLEAHYCGWLIPHLRHQLAGGSMYAVRLPAPLPSPGSKDGPPLPAGRKYLFSVPLDFRAMMIAIAEDPKKIRPAFEDLVRLFAPKSIGDEIYPPKEPVKWPWSR